MTVMKAAQDTSEAQGADGDKALFVDGGVYTRNRAFRLFLSSKAGKDAVLQLTGLPPGNVSCNMFSTPIGVLSMPSAVSGSVVDFCSRYQDCLWYIPCLHVLG